MRSVIHYPTELLIIPQEIKYFLSLTVVISVAGHIFVHILSYFFDITNTPFLGLYSFFSMSSEANLPTYLSALNLLVAGLLCGFIFHTETLAKKSINRYWLGLSILLILMSIDEAAQIHDGIVGPILDSYLGKGEGIMYYRWYLAYIPLIIAISLLYVPFIKRLPLRYSSRLIGVACIFIGGSIGVELIEGALRSAQLNTAISVLFEESLEMISIVLLIHTLLLYLAEARYALKIRFSQRHEY